MRAPQLPGPELRRIREAFGLTRGKFCETIGLSESTLVRKERDTSAIGDDVADAMSPYLVTAYDAGLVVGLSMAAIEAAEGQGLRSAPTPLGKVYWVPLIHEWAARIRAFFPRSIASQAVHLAEVLGLAPEEGTARCGACDARGLETPRIALRRCVFCQVALCTDEACGDEFTPENHNVRFALPVACVQCFARRHLLRRCADGHLPGRSGYADHLAKRYEEISKLPTQSYLHSFLGIIEAAHREALARRDAVQVAIGAERALADSATNPNIGRDLRVALAEANRQVAQIGRLLSRVNGDLQSTHPTPE